MRNRRKRSCLAFILCAMLVFQMIGLTEDYPVAVAAEASSYGEDSSVRGSLRPVFQKGTGTYGYNSLTAAQKEFYSELETSLTEFESKNKPILGEALIGDSFNNTISTYYYPFHVDYSKFGLGAREAIQTWTAFCADRPWLFWISDFDCGGQSFTPYVGSDYEKNLPAVWEMYGTIEEHVSEYLDAAAEVQGTYEKVRVVYDRLINTIDYAYQSDGKTPETEDWARSIVGVFDGTHRSAVGEGYAKAFSFLMNILDIPNVYIVGKGKGAGHAWNAVSFDGGETYYYVDAAWDAINGENTALPENPYVYFAMPGTAFEKNHVPNSPDAWAACDWQYELPELGDDMDYTYFARYAADGTSVTLEDENDINEFLKTARVLAPGENCLMLLPDTDTLEKVASVLGESSPSSAMINEYGMVLYSHPAEQFAAETPADTVSLSEKELTVDETEQEVAITIASVTENSDDYITFYSTDERVAVVKEPYVKAKAGETIRIEIRGKGTAEIYAKACASEAEDSCTIIVGDEDPDVVLTPAPTPTETPTVAEKPTVTETPSYEEDSSGHGSLRPIFQKGTGRYAYSRLSTAQQEFYSALETSLMDFESSEDAVFERVDYDNGDVMYFLPFENNFSQFGLNRTDAVRTFMAFRADHPWLFWINNVSQGEEELQFIVTSGYEDMSSIRDIYDTIEEQVKGYLEAAAAVHGTYEKVRVVYDRLIKEIDYIDKSDNPEEWEEKWAHNIVGVLDGTHKSAASNGYADAFSFLMNLLDIPNVYIKGKVDKKEEGVVRPADHWNAVSFDGGATYYYVDAARDDINGENMALAENPYVYFAMPKTAFEKRHAAVTPSGWPLTWQYELPELGDDMDYTYFARYAADGTSVTLEDENDINEFLKTARVLAPGENCLMLLPDTDTLEKVASVLGESSPSSAMINEYGMVLYSHPAEQFAAKTPADTVSLSDKKLMVDETEQERIITIASVTENSDDYITFYSTDERVAVVKEPYVKAKAGETIRIEVRGKGTAEIYAKACAGEAEDSCTIIVGDEDPDVVLTPAPTATPEETEEPVVTETPIVTPTPTPDVTEKPTVTATPTPEVTEKPTVTATPTPEVTEKPTMTPTPTPDVTEKPTMTPTPTMTPAPTPEETEKPVVTETPIVTPTPKPKPGGTKLTIISNETIQNEIKLIKNTKVINVTFKVSSKKAVSLKWKKNKVAHGYKIYRSMKKKKGFKCIKTIKKRKTTKWVDRKVKSGKTYYYKLRAYKKIKKKTYYSKYTKLLKVRVK